MGETGETILVGGDFLMRSNSYRDPKNHNLVPSLKHPKTGKVDTAATRAAIEKKEAGTVITTDYVGNETLIAYGPIDILGITWCLNAKMDTSVAFAAMGVMQETANQAGNQLVFWCLGVAGVATVVVFLVAFTLSGKIVNPITVAAKYAKTIASGDLQDECKAKAKAKAEVGELIDSMNDMRTQLREVVGKLGKNSETLVTSSSDLGNTATELTQSTDESQKQSSAIAAAAAAAAEEMSVNMQQMAKNTDDMSDKAKMVATSVQEMTTTINEIASHAEKSAGIANSAAKLAQVSNEKIGNLGDAADEIGKVIEVISDIAEQTNLLALNATIEAARAGVAGNGFAVVATEVKELAKQTATATEDIRTRIEGIQNSSGEAVTSIAEITTVIDDVNEIARTIAAAVEEQSTTTKHIADNVSQTAQNSETVARGINETALASSEITKNVASAEKSAKRTATAATETKSASGRLDTIATEMQELVGGFKM